MFSSRDIVEGLKRSILGVITSFIPAAAMEVFFEVVKAFE
jgi:hypothetical protein